MMLILMLILTGTQGSDPDAGFYGEQVFYHELENSGYLNWNLIFYPVLNKCQKLRVRCGKL